MQILRNEVRTGILVLLTIGLATGLVLYLSSPGIFKPLHVFYVFLDNAAGIKPGATVMLAGRKIGTVSNIQSPVPFKNRPPGHPNYEVMITVEVAAEARIDKQTTVTMRTFGLLAELVIDFTSGNEQSGLAQSGDSFVGVRAPELGEIGPEIIDRINPVLKEAALTLVELRKTSQNLTNLTAESSPLLTRLNTTLQAFGLVASDLNEIVGKNGTVPATLSKLQETLVDLKQITQQVASGDHLEKTLANLNVSSARLKDLLREISGSMGVVLPHLGEITGDLSQLTGQLKKQPWRLVWPTTINYATGQDSPEPAASPSRRASRVSKP